MIRGACPSRTAGATREAQAIKSLEGGVLDQLQKKFQIRIYRLDRQISRVPKLDDLKTSPPASATRIGDGLKQLAGEAADLPIGAVVLLSDGADNSGGIDLDTISTFRSRRIPVHTVGFGLEQVGARRGDQRRCGRAARACRFAPRRQGDAAPARVRGAEGDADGARRRQSSCGAADYSRRRRRNAERDAFIQSGRRRSEDAPVFRSIRFRARKIATTIPSRGSSTSNPPSAESCMSRASRAGNINLFAARSRMTGC